MGWALWVLRGETVRDKWSIGLEVAREGIAVRRAPGCGLSGRVRHIARGLICRGERDDSGGCPTFLVGWTPVQPCRFARTRHSDRAHYNTAIYKRCRFAAQMIFFWNSYPRVYSPCSGVGRILHTPHVYMRHLLVRLPLLLGILYTVFLRQAFEWQCLFPFARPSFS
jgi:hypothetical protein